MTTRYVIADIVSTLHSERITGISALCRSYAGRSGKSFWRRPKFPIGDDRPAMMI